MMFSDNFFLKKNLLRKSIQGADSSLVNSRHSLLATGCS